MVKKTNDYVYEWRQTDVIQRKMRNMITKMIFENFVYNVSSNVRFQPSHLYTIHLHSTWTDRQ